MTTTNRNHMTTTNRKAMDIRLAVEYDNISYFYRTL